MLGGVSRARDHWLQVDEKRQGIVDSWPADVDDSAARRDWGFAPRYDFETAFRDYLIPTIRDRYRRGLIGRAARAPPAAAPARPPFTGRPEAFAGTPLAASGGLP